MALKASNPFVFRYAVGTSMPSTEIKQGGVAEETAQVCRLTAEQIILFPRMMRPPCLFARERKKPSVIRRSWIITADTSLDLTHPSSGSRVDGSTEPVGRWKRSLPIEFRATSSWKLTDHVFALPKNINKEKQKKTSFPITGPFL